MLSLWNEHLKFYRPKIYDIIKIKIYENEQTVNVHRKEHAHFYNIFNSYAITPSGCYKNFYS